ncbi:MAG: HDOD domain-containing protein [Pseudomonadota bacterium]
MSNLLDHIKSWFGISQDARPEGGAAPHASLSPDAPAELLPDDTARKGRLPDSDLVTPQEAKYLHELFLGSALGLDLQLLPGPDRAASALIRQQLKGLATPEGRRRAVPRLPAVVPLFLRSLRDPNSSATDFVEIISRDPVLTTNVLRLVNSAFYNPSGRDIDSIHRAVVVLGLDGLRFAVSSAVMHPILETANSDFAAFGPALWQHSQDCALICQVLAPRAGAQAFEAYLTGMVHEVGTVTLFNQLSGACRAAGLPAADCLVHAFQVHGNTLCAEIVKDWQMPTNIINAVTDQATSPPAASTLGGLLERANQLAEAYFLRSRNETQTLPGTFFASEEAMNFFERISAMRAKISAASG